MKQIEKLKKSSPASSDIDPYYPLASKLNELIDAWNERVGPGVENTPKFTHEQVEGHVVRLSNGQVVRAVLSKSGLYVGKWFDGSCGMQFTIEHVEEIIF